jgi:hypothetical protein
MMAAVDASTVQGQIRGLQIIVGAMVMGVVAFSIVTMIIPPPKTTPSAGLLLPPLASVGIFLAVLTQVARKLTVSYLQNHLVSALATMPANPEAEIKALIDLLRRKTILSAAMIEGPAFFMLVTYLIERHPLSLFAAGLLAIGIIMQMPTAAGTAKWIEAQMALIQQRRAPSS